MEISCCTGSDDFELFNNIINQGIDARLEAFTNSTFEIKGNRLFINIDTSEISIFMRRLSMAAEIEAESIDNWTADQWEDDILEIYFGIDLRC